MARNKKPIAAHFIMAFEGNLKRKSIDEHDDIQASLEDMGGFLDDESIRFKDLPTAIPEVVRRELVKKSEAAISMLNEVTEMLAQLETVSGRLLNKREAEEEKKKPHCDKCGQAIPAKRRK